jgi:hypothetical protein
MAYLASLILNIANQVYADPKEKPKLLTPADCLPIWDTEKRKMKEQGQSVEEMKSVLLTIASAQNKNVERLNKLHKDAPNLLGKKPINKKK